MTNSRTVDMVNGTFRFGVAVGEQHKGHGYADEAVLLLLRYMFDERRSTTPTRSCVPDCDV